jgi:hypothetical protein
MLEFSNNETNYDVVRDLESRILLWDDAKYFADREYVTNSMCNAVETSPLHLQHYLNTPQDEKEHNNFGKAFHCIILEPTEFEKRYFVLDDTAICNQIGGAKPRGTNRYKEWKQDYILLNDGKAELSFEDYNDALEMRDRIQRIPEITNLLGMCKKEVILKDEYMGTKRKGKIDAIRFGDFVLDAKSTKDPVKEFKKKFFNYRYHKQGAYYGTLAKTRNVLFLAVEKKAPYSIELVKMTEESFDTGVQQFERDLEVYNRYFTAGRVKESLAQFFTKSLI